jgi:antitoxin component YwqK of YwqJK toxin-antitoxin module
MMKKLIIYCLFAFFYANLYAQKKPKIKQVEIPTLCPYNKLIRGANHCRYEDTTLFPYGCRAAPGPRKFINNKKKEIKFYSHFIQDSTKIACEYVYQYGVLRKYTSYWFNGQVCFLAEYDEEGYCTGERPHYSRDGKLVSKYYYKNKAIYLKEYYYPNGVLKQEIEFKRINKKPVTLYKYYYENGNIKAYGFAYYPHYTNDFKIGLWYYYDENGELIKQVKHKLKKHYVPGPGWNKLGDKRD